jgi:ABC-type multidrug transport system fused ATPase/permease subunit
MKKDSNSQRVDKSKIWPILRRFLLVVKPHWKWLILSFLSFCILSFLAIFEARTLGVITDSVIAMDSQLLLKNIGLLAIVIGGYIVFMVGSAYSDERFTESGVNTIRNKIAESIIRLPVSGLDKEKTGDLVSRLNSDLNLVRRFLSEGFGILFFSPVMFIAGFIYSMTVNWKLAVFSSMILPALMYFATMLTKPVERHTRSMQKGKSELNILAQDSISGFAIVKSFNLKTIMKEKAIEQIDAVMDHEIVLNKWFSLIAPINQFIRYLPELTLFLVGGFLVFRGEMTLGEIIIFSRLIRFIAYPVQSVSRMLYMLREFIPGAERVMEVWDKPKESAGISTKCVDEEIAIEFNNVSFRYDPAIPVIENLSFSVKSGDIIALVGRSGCGKTTVIKLMSRFYVNGSGEILLYGRTLNDWDMETMRGKIALVSQDTYLFPESIYANIAYGKPDATEQEVFDVSKKAGCWEFIREFPRQFETEVGERGIRLSAGQRQRIAIARALLKDAPVLLLDEATSSLDTESEFKVQQGINLLLEKRTAIVIAHRLSTIKHANRILVLEQGNIKEEGAHEELMGKNGLYSQLYMKQFRDPDRNE